jgi:hypothetical protein
MLRKPKIKRRANYYKNTSVVPHVDWFGAVPIFGPIFVDPTYLTYTENKNKLEYELKEDLQFVLNPSAEIDYEKTQISAAWKIPIVYKRICEGECNLPVVFDDNRYIVTYYGKKFCYIQPDSLFNLSNSRKFIKISNPLFNQDTAYYSTPYIPIEHFKNLRFSYDFEQKACSEFSDIPSGIRLSLMIHYVYKPNAYGEVNEHFQTLDYGVDVETTDNFTKPQFSSPTSGTVTIGNTVFTRDTTIYADSIVLNGNISSINGAIVRIISTKPISQISGTIDPSITYYQGTIYPANPIIPLEEEIVKEFCSSDDYKAKSYPFSSKLFSEFETKGKEIIEFSVSFYPNPAKDIVNVKLDGYQNSSVSLKVYDLLGREALAHVEKDINAKTHTIHLNTESLLDGTYFVKVWNGFEEKTEKLMINRQK